MEDFVTFEIAKKLKEKGFKEHCLAHYGNTGGFYSNVIDTYDRPNQDLDYIDFLNCFNAGNSIGLIDAPTISQVLKWLREEKKISLEICIHCSLKWVYTIFAFDDGLFMDYTPYLDDIDVINDTIYELYDSYEEAALVGIEYVLDNLI